MVLAGYEAVPDIVTASPKAPASTVLVNTIVRGEALTATPVMGFPLLFKNGDHSAAPELTSKRLTFNGARSDCLK